MILRQLTDAFNKPNWFTLAVCPFSAISGLVQVRRSNDTIGLSLPFPNPDEGSQPDPLVVPHDLGPEFPTYFCCGAQSEH
jgi:hypothetical protein